MEEINKIIEIDYIENKTYDDKGNLINHEYTKYKNEPKPKNIKEIIETIIIAILWLIALIIICITTIEYKKIHAEQKEKIAKFEENTIKIESYEINKLKEFIETIIISE